MSPRRAGSTRRIMLIKEIWAILFVMYSTSKCEDNVALYKQAEQSSVDPENNSRGASKAVDGCQTKSDNTSSCCTKTRSGEKEAWWRVDLGEPMSVNDIAINVRERSKMKFAGYHLYLSNTTDTPTDGVLCYKDQSRNRTDVQLVVTHECPYVARYVTVYNYRNDTKRRSWYSDNTVLELCEVQVYGCPIGMYGDGDCNSQCSAVCYGGNCNSTTGACFYGRNPAYVNDRCSASGIEIGFGLVIVILVIVVILLARRPWRVQPDNKTPSHVTDISELDKDQANRDITDNELEANDTDRQDAQVEIVDGNYENLYLELIESHLYQETGAMSE